MGTYKEQFDSAMQCKTRKEAKAWLEKEVIHYWEEFGKGRDEAEAIILDNLGYMAGYYDNAMARKVHRLFRAEHPIFGAPAKSKSLSADNMVRVGMEMARKKA